MMILVYILLGLVGLFFFLVLFAFLIGEGFKKKFGKYDMPDRLAEEFIRNLLPEMVIPDNLLPVLISELRTLGFQTGITDEQTKVHLRNIILEELGS